MDLELKPLELELELIFWRLARVGVGVETSGVGVGVGVDIMELTPTLRATDGRYSNGLRCLILLIYHMCLILKYTSSIF